LSPASGAVGESVTIMGTGFGGTQGASTVSLNGTGVTITSWSDISIVAIVPSGASSGPFSATVNGQAVYSASFNVTTLPSGWSDTDVGSVGIAGNASFANGVFTVNGSGLYVYYTADQMHFMYQPLSGDGTIVARVVSVTGINASQGGVMIRETLTPSSTEAFVSFGAGSAAFTDRATTGGSAALQGNNSVTLPYWVKLVRSGSTFSAYYSSSGLTWSQIGTSQTINMAQNVYIGLVTCSESNSTLATANFDNVSVSSAIPAPAITAVSATTGSIGSQVTITGTGFGNSENGSLVTLNDAPVIINSWTNTSITITIPSGATSGYLAVSVAPSMNDGNAIFFTLTSQPLPSPWLD
jgi:regulation of enolase protein 1 (concanavalin A-like superfamily)